MNRLAWTLVIILGSLLSADVVHQTWLALGGTSREALGAAGATGLAAFSVGMTLYRLFKTTGS